MLEMEHFVPETIELDIKDYPILISPGLYEFFLANRKLGLEALLLYIHLQYTVRRQKTNQIWAKNVYHLPLNDLDQCFGQCIRVLKHKGVLAVAYVNKYDGYSEDRYGDLLSFYAPAEIDDMLSDFNLKKLCNVPTDGEIFGRLNDLVTQFPHNLAKLHAWLDNNPAVFEDPVWKDKSVHALYVGRRT